MQNLSRRALAALAACSATPAALARATDRATFREFLPLFQQGTAQFLNGDAALWKRNVLHSEQATIMGAWGAYEKGWAEVESRYDWAATRFRKDSGATMSVEILAMQASTELAYTVAIERSMVHLADQAQAAPMALRVTHVFARSRNGVWKLAHRHADPLMAKTAPATVLHHPR